MARTLGLLYLITFWMTCGGLPTWAADITFAPPTPKLTDKLARPEFGEDEMLFFVPEYVIRIDGDIVAGDAKKFEQILIEVQALRPNDAPDLFKRNILVTLNSKGGSFKDGVDIARLLDRNQIPTLLESGAECLSACAVIFMAGTEQFPESREVHTRMVEIPSRLGFHRPFISEFKTEIPPDLVAELGAAELQEIFADEYLLAFDLANQLIQEMLAVDPNAWQGDLLVKMLTANNQSADGRFVYLSTVADAIDWDIEILNIRTPTGGDLQTRYTRAFWACYNTSKRVEFSDKGFWPALDRVDEFLQWNVRLLNDPGLVQSPLRIRAEVDGVTFNVTMEQLGETGCRVVFDQEFQSATVIFTTQGGPTETLYYSNPKDRIVLFHPNTPLVELGEKPAVQTNSAIKRVANGRCLVFGNGQKIDDEPCQAASRHDPDLGLIEKYTWPSGAVTVVVRRNRTVQINGNTASSVDLPEADAQFCLLNSNSGNIFCYSGT